jgi:acetyl-CoA synthetase
MSTRNNQNSNFPFSQKIAWQPNSQWIQESNLQKFMDKHNIQSYDKLYKQSIRDIAWFWDTVLKDMDIQFFKPYSKVIDLSDGLHFPKWCIDGQMNIIHNCLDKWQDTDTANKIALKWEGEEKKVRNYTYKELYNEVNRCANSLRGLGLGMGDAIGLFMPMIPELAIAFLAIIKIGGIILPLFSGYGPKAISTRLADANAKALFTTDGFYRRGKKIVTKSIADEALKNVPTLQYMIVFNRVGLQNISWNPNRDIWWNEFVDNKSTENETEHTSAEDVLMIIYTSGTTGKPKGAVHTHCGFPVKAAQDMYYSMDLKPENTMYWMSDMGWMMGPWEVFGSLLIGASMVFYDGAPDYPDVDRLWQLVEKHKITHLGISPTLIRSLKSHGIEPIKKHNISSLRMVGSTGSPWDPESWMWLFKNVLESKKPILNYSGGTEISGGIVCGNFFKPIKPVAFSGPVVGMDVDVLDENGNSIRNAVGELVIRQPWIGMTRGFWKDNQRYLETYWNRFENLWLHGDFAAVDEDGLWYILGRSDDTIKISGKRLGSAEVESILNAHPAVIESAAIGVPHDIKGEELVAFCVLKKDIQSVEKIREELIDLIIKELGKPLKPKEIKFATALPKTRNAKIMHRVIRAAYLGKDTGDISSLENTKSISAIRNSN